MPSLCVLTQGSNKNVRVIFPGCRACNAHFLSTLAEHPSVTWAEWLPSPPCDGPCTRFGHTLPPPKPVPESFRTAVKRLVVIEKNATWIEDGEGVKLVKLLPSLKTLTLRGARRFTGEYVRMIQAVRGRLVSLIIESKCDIKPLVAVIPDTIQVLALGGIVTTYGQLKQPRLLDLTETVCAAGYVQLLQNARGMTSLCEMHVQFSKGVIDELRAHHRHLTKLVIATDDLFAIKQISEMGWPWLQELCFVSSLFKGYCQDYDFDNVTYMFAIKKSVSGNLCTSRNMWK